MRVGEALAVTDTTVTRRIIAVDAGDPTSARRGRWGGWFYRTRQELDGVDRVAGDAQLDGTDRGVPHGVPPRRRLPAVTVLLCAALLVGDLLVAAPDARYGNARPEEQLELPGGPDHRTIRGHRDRRAVDEVDADHRL
jgi:hypothetical protein